MMKARSMMLVLAGSVALAPLAMAQDHAVPRGGGGGGGSSGGGQPAVHSSGGGSSSGGSGYSGGTSSTGSSSSTTAERRHPRAGTGRGSYYGGRGGYYGGYYPYYGGSYYPGFYGSYWWPYGAYGWYGGYWGYPWGWGGGGGMYHYVEHETGAVRVLVDPTEARVYVDGYYAGTVDDFDGLFQRLNVAPGRHEITLKLEGYKTHRMRVYVSPEHTLKLHYTMQKGSGETFEDLAANVPESELQRDRGRERARDREQEQNWSERDRADQNDDAANAGRLRLNVRPSDASVYVDGAFRGDAREASSMRLPAGRHRVEIVRPGYRTVEREVEVTPGQSTDLSVDLDKGSI